MDNTTNHPARTIAGGATGLINRFERWLEDRQRRRAEEYLAKSESIYDLEHRMRQLATEMDQPRFMRQQ